jgi:Putative transposase of IS4/5 family (DUF4096)
MVKPGRKPVPTRRVLEAVLWILNTGAQWHMLPQSYPNYKTVHRRFQSWCHSEVLRRVLTDVANELRDKGVLDEEESFIDATFAMAKGGGAEIAGGENALRVPREWRGKTQLHISHKTNIGQGYISDLENGRTKGTTAASKKNRERAQSSA